ncbi:JmjC domain-containing protein [Methylobacterium aquaticum]|uniref:JmjC domain-containing protein n=1 Tax=Methylobacterium aquaticum TaxID=270351 RepID=UPI003D16BD3D
MKQRPASLELPAAGSIDRLDDAAARPFQSLLGPVATDVFCQDYWARSVLHVARNDPDYYRDLIALAEIEEHLSADEFFERHSAATPYRGAGPPEPPPRSPSDVFARLAEGKPLRLRRLETILPPASPVLALVRDMERCLHHPRASVSCYVAPADGLGLGPHHDESEIFTLQIAGSKIWRIYHKVVADEPALYEPEALGPPEHEIRLNPGDLLYTPSGCVHDVTVAEAGPSFSLTIVFEPFRWRTLLDLLAARVAAMDAFMAPLPAGPRDGTGPETAFADDFAARVALLHDALADLAPADLTDLLAVRHLHRTTYPPGRQIDSVFRARALDAETRVEMVPDLPWHLARHGDTVELTLAGGFTLRAKASLETALRQALAARGPFRVREMHGSLTQGARIALAKRLVACGLLRLA